MKSASGRGRITLIGTTSIEHDDAGNLTKDDLRRYLYNGEGRLVKLRNLADTTDVAEYVLDGAGLRVKKCVPNCSSPTARTVYVLSGSKVIAEYDDGAAVGSPSREYIFAASQMVASIEGSTTRYHHADHLSARVTTDTSGAKIGAQGHLPFGKSWYTEDVIAKQRFTSYERDSESGNDYAMFRSHISRIARFSAPDPIAGSILDPQSLNRYAYVRNDPVNMVDPLGLYVSESGTSMDVCSSLGASELWPWFCGGGGQDLFEVIDSTDGQRPGGGAGSKKTKCIFNIHINYDVGNSSLTKTLLSELRRIYGDAGVGFKVVPNAKDADFLINVRGGDPTSRTAEWSDLGGSWRPGGARGGYIEIYYNVLATWNPKASPAALGMAAGAVAAHEVGHGIYPNSPTDHSKLDYSIMKAPIDPFNERLFWPHGNRPDVRRVCEEFTKARSTPK
jgi:RHS repeat-associated protein